MKVGDITMSNSENRVYEELYTHIWGVMELATMFATYLKLSQKEVSTVRLGTLLHDIGKFFIPREILFKEGILSAEDFAIIKQHSQLGYEYLKTGKIEAIRDRIPHSGYEESLTLIQEEYGFIQGGCPTFDDDILAIVAQHHERVDGKGYPFGLRGDEIDPLAKLVSLCDVFDAITSKRCYKPKFDENYALNCIEEGLGTQFDEKLGSEFISFVRGVWLQNQTEAKKEQQHSA